MVITLPILAESASAHSCGSSCASASCYSRPEDIHIFAVVVAELEFRDVQRQVLLADFMEAADDAALKDRPEALDRIGMDRNGVGVDLTTKPGPSGRPLPESIPRLVRPPPSHAIWSRDQSADWNVRSRSAVRSNSRDFRWSRYEAGS